MVSATNASSSGVGILSGSDGRSVYFPMDYNPNGYVAKWVNIKPKNGSFTVRGEPHVYGENKVVIWGAFMLQEEAFVIPTLTFDGNGATDGSMDPQTASTPTALTQNAFTRTGYTFTGWNTQADGKGTPYADKAEYSFAASLTLYAQWEANTYTMNFDGNDGTPPVPTSKSVTFGSAYGELATTTRYGHTFAGWFTDSTGGTKVTAETIVEIDAEHTRCPVGPQRYLYPDD